MEITTTKNLIDDIRGLLLNAGFVIVEFNDGYDSKFIFMLSKNNRLIVRYDWEYSCGEEASSIKSFIRHCENHIDSLSEINVDARLEYSKP